MRRVGYYWAAKVNSTRSLIVHKMAQQWYRVVFGGTEDNGSAVLVDLDGLRLIRDALTDVIHEEEQR